MNKMQKFALTRSFRKFNDENIEIIRKGGILIERSLTIIFDPIKPKGSPSRCWMARVGLYIFDNETNKTSKKPIRTWTNSMRKLANNQLAVVLKDIGVEDSLIFANDDTYFYMEKRCNDEELAIHAQYYDLSLNDYRNNPAEGE